MCEYKYNFVCRVCAYMYVYLWGCEFECVGVGIEHVFTCVMIGIKSA